MLVFDAIIDGIRSLKDGSLKISLESQELQPDKMAEFFSLKGMVKVLISQENISKEVVEKVTEVPLIDTTKKYSMSQKQRFALMALFERHSYGYEKFEDFYNWYMNGVIDKINQTYETTI